MDRRRFLAACATAGITAPLFPGALLALAAATEKETVSRDAYPPITTTMIAAAEGIAGIQLNEDQRKMLLDGVNGLRAGAKQIRELKMPFTVAPATVMNPRPDGFKMPPQANVPVISAAPDVSSLAKHDSNFSFASVRELAELLRTRRVSSVTLTKLFLSRLRRYDPHLHFVVNYTEDRALEQAAKADREIAAGRYLGPLHGVPYGAKDLLSVAGYPTTWGAHTMEEQRFEITATVVERLDAAGAILLAKMSMGSLALGDLWFGGRTRNPWNPKQGSSGSSAGSASAVSAGCLPFAIGSETLGSIASPSARCGVTGFRPSFGLVPRTGAMPASWSMDKLGPICRSVEDCALVLNVIAGADGIDRTVQNDVAFRYDAGADWKTLRIGYNKPKFEPADLNDVSAKPANSNKEAMKGWLTEKNYQDTRHYDNRYDVASLEVVRSMGITPVPIRMPNLPWQAMTAVLEAEDAASFDELTRSGRDALLYDQATDDWPNIFRTSRFYTAVDYIQAQRARTLGIAAMAKLFEEVDVIVTPTGGTQQRITNLTGQPCITVPVGIRGNDAPVPPDTGDGSALNVGGPGTPVSISFLGGLYDDARLAAFVQAFQQHTGFHKLHPKL